MAEPEPAVAAEAPVVDARSADAHADDAEPVVGEHVADRGAGR